MNIDTLDKWLDETDVASECPLLFAVLQVISEEEVCAGKTPGEIMPMFRSGNYSIPDSILAKRFVGPLISEDSPERRIQVVGQGLETLLRSVQNRNFELMFRVVTTRKQRVFEVFENGPQESTKVDTPVEEIEEVDPQLPKKIRKLFDDEEILFLQSMRDDAGHPMFYTDREILKFITNEEAYDRFIAREENDPAIIQYCEFYQSQFPGLRYQISEAGRCLTQIEIVVSESDPVLEDEGETPTDTAESEEDSVGDGEELDREPTEEELAEIAEVEAALPFAQVIAMVLKKMKPGKKYRKSELYEVLTDKQKAKLSGGEEYQRLTIGEQFVVTKFPAMNHWLNNDSQKRKKQLKDGFHWEMEKEGKHYTLKQVPNK